MVVKRKLKASCSLNSLWIPPLRGDVSLETTKLSQSLQMSSSFAKHNISLAALLNNVDKVGAQLFSQLPNAEPNCYFINKS